MASPDIFSLEGKVALVTGSGRGIGRGIALCMAESGADVIVADFAEDRMEQTSSEIIASGRKSIGIKADMREADQVNAMFEQAFRKFGKVDILVNNAGTPTHWDNRELSPKGWDTMLTENLKTTFLCMQAGSKLMKDNKVEGAIINISSTSAIGTGSGTAYGAAKAGVNSLTQSWSVILAPDKIRVNAVMPGQVLHPVSLVYSNFQDPEVKAAAESRVPLGRLGTPEDIGWACVFLASEAASYITGQVIGVCGGPS